MRPTMAKSAVHDKVFQQGAGIETFGQNLPYLIKSSNEGQDLRTTKADGKTHLASPPTGGRISFKCGQFVSTVHLDRTLK
jgi:hypothetical protein